MISHGRISRIASFGWSDPDLLNGQMSCDEMSCLDESPNNCKGPCLSNQQNQKDNHENELMDDAYSCGPAQGDWDACAPAAVNCIPAVVNCVPVTTPLPNHHHDRPQDMLDLLLNSSSLFEYDVL